MLELKNIIKDYKVADTKFRALNDINLTFQKGEFVSIIGPSGCGKTTALNIIGGLDRYSKGDLDFISQRVLELSYTACDIRPFAEDLGFMGEPFPFDPERRHILKSELDAYYAKLYGLTRDELRYILDPADIMGEDYPSETFRVLKNKEMKQFGEYRTQRLVLDAWDKLESGELK